MSKKTKYVCGDCHGKGQFLVLKRAKDRGLPGVKQAFVAKKCKPCKGTGWVDIQA